MKDWYGEKAPEVEGGRGIIGEGEGWETMTKVEELGDWLRADNGMAAKVPCLSNYSYTMKRIG